MGDLRLKNGSVVYADGADDGALRIQGKNLRGAWCDEVGLWKRWKTAWDESLKYAVRKAPARIIATGTPKRAMPAIALVKRLLADPKVVKSLLRTEDNAANLDADTLAELLEAKGTALGRQELEGEILDEAEGALWTHDEAKAQALGLGLIVHGTLPAQGLGRRVLAVDPSDGEENSDEYGLAVATIDAARRCYVLASDGVRKGPGGNVDHTVAVYERWECDVVVVEKNHGGGYLPTMLRERGLPVITVSASQGKRTRAEPVAAMYAPGRPGVVHVDTFTELEDQQTAFTGASDEESPDRLDALVWALSSLNRPRGTRMTHAGRAA
jgi:phage terminase large subunit-like protein